MIKKLTCSVKAISRVLASLVVFSVVSSANANIAYTGVFGGESYEQTMSGLRFVDSVVGFTLSASGPGQFNEVDIRAPGQSVDKIYSFNPQLTSFGLYQGALGFKSYGDPNVNVALAKMEAENPFGTYSLTAKNTITGTSQTALLNYDFNHFPAIPNSGGEVAVPTLNGQSFASLQGINAAVQHALGINTFTADAVPLNSSEVTPFVTIYISKSSDGTAVYQSAALKADVGNIVLPARTLESNTSYDYALQFSNLRHCGVGFPCDPTNVIGSFQQFSTVSYGTFQTAAAPPILPVSLTLQGGTLSNPVPLVYQQQVGQLNGTIGGFGDQAFYRFFWQGGNFKANNVVTGADPLAQYSFELIDSLGNVLSNELLSQGNGFTADLSRILTSGTYEIGLVSISPFDPAFTITFDTPVSDVPEPSSVALMFLGLLGFAASRRKPA